MDRITRAYLKDFQASFEIPSPIDETVLFEHFANFTLVDPKIEDQVQLDEINIGRNSTIGIDGFCLILNKQICYDVDGLREYLETHNSIIAEAVFVQAKTSSKFDSKEIGNFGWSVHDFVKEHQSINWPPHARDCIAMLNLVLENTTKLSTNPICTMYYVSLGTYQANDILEARRTQIISDIVSEKVFSTVTLEYIDAEELQRRYKKIGQALVREIEFKEKLTLPQVDSVKESYLGFVTAKELIGIVEDEAGGIIHSVFYDNVRDYQGDNPVNKEIRGTLESSSGDKFLMMNNGVTVVCEEIQVVRNKLRLTNFQIINGCQTTHVLHECKELLSDNVFVALKLVCSSNPDLVSKIIRSTNRQTEIKEQDLLAFSNYQRKLEDFYATFDPSKRLYYERRSKQFNSLAVPKVRIVDKTTQIKCIGSMYFDQPDLATRFFGSLYSELGDRLFLDEHKPIVYYTSAYALFRIDEMLRLKRVDEKFRKIKFFLLMMLKYEVIGHGMSQLNSKDVEKECDQINQLLHDDNRLESVLGKITSKIDTFNVNMEGNELSKSSAFTRQCKEIYLKK